MASEVRLPPGVAKYVDALSTMGTIEETHVLDEATNLLVHLLEHVNAFRASSSDTSDGVATMTAPVSGVP